MEQFKNLINSDKTKLVCFKTKQCTLLLVTNIEINNKIIENVDKVKLLGLIVDIHLFFYYNSKTVLQIYIQVYSRSV